MHTLTQDVFCTDAVHARAFLDVDTPSTMLAALIVRSRARVPAFAFTSLIIRTSEARNCRTINDCSKLQLGETEVGLVKTGAEDGNDMYRMMAAERMAHSGKEFCQLSDTFAMRTIWAVMRSI
jgi:hypothetical protein